MDNRIEKYKKVIKKFAAKKEFYIKERKVAFYKGDRWQYHTYSNLIFVITECIDIINDIYRQ